MKAFPHYSARVCLALDGVWDFAFLGETADLAGVDLGAVAYRDIMCVPGVFDVTPAYAGRRGLALYRRRVSAPAHARLRLTCGGQGLWARVFWDGKAVGTLDLPYSGCALDFTAGAGTEHELVIAIDNRFDSARTPLFLPYYDFYAFGGIYRSVELHILPPTNLERVRVRTLDLDAGRVELDIGLGGHIPDKLSFTVAFDGAAPRAFARSVKDGHAGLELEVPRARAWSPDAPHLHTVTVALADDAVTERFGLRTVATRGRDILVNGQPVKLLGYCRHESHMEFGPVQPLPLLIEDLQYLKDLGCNFVRGTHYPQDQRFLDLCDELGFLVWEESLGWGNQTAQLNDPAFRDGQIRQTRAMVRNSINHPAILLWGFLNEGPSHDRAAAPLYDELIALLRTEDPTRLVTCASFHPRDDLHFAKLDVVSLNAYPGWYAADQVNARPLHEVVPFFDDFIARLAAQGLDDKPFIISEFGAGAIYGWRDRFKAHWSEEYQAEMLDIICRYVLERPRVAGLALWHFADARTYTNRHALGRPRTINDKGTLDEYRRPKLAYDVVRRAFRGAVAVGRPA